MIIKELHLTNFRGFEQLDVVFHERLAVFIGTNGAGKSAVLDAISILFSNLIASSIRQAFNSTKRADILFNYDDLRIGTSESKLRIKTVHDSEINTDYFDQKVH